MRLVQILSLLVVAGAVCATEVGVPERYLRPRHFNPHPLQTLLGGPGAQPLRLPQLLDQHPYQYFQRPPGPPGRQDSSPVQFPAVPETVKATKSSTPGYITVPKNYAFAYAVKDRHSGDDFSHKQAHNGQSTKGEYRVKLPDGRTQIVSYTADNNGYKADVRYDEAAKLPHYQPQIQQQQYRPSPHSGGGTLYYRPSAAAYHGLSNSILQDADYPEDQEVVYKQPVQILSKPHSVAQQYSKVQPTPQPLEVLFSPTPQPYKTLALQYRALPQTAEEYTSSDAPNYYPTYDNYAPPVSSTVATPIVEDQDDIPAPRKPQPVSAQYYTATTPAPPSSGPGVRYILVPHPTQYVYTDTDS